MLRPAMSQAVAPFPVVDHQRVVFPDGLALDCGAVVRPLVVAYRTYGTLNADRSNAVLVCHALTGDQYVAETHPVTGRPGWWESVVGPGRPIDTDRFFVVCANLLGGCSGTTGPSSIDPRTGRPYGLRFPHVTVGDLVAVHRRLVAHLGIERLHGAIGGSLGGMQVLQWAMDHPDDIARAVVICASARLSAQNIAFSAVARASIMRDEHFHGGDYYETGEEPRVGLAVARMLAHITYVSDVSLERKFGRDRRNGARPSFDVDFEVESYLHHQGHTFVERFDANSYLYLTRVMDYFDPFGDAEAARAKLSRCRSEFLLVSFDTDWRFPTAHSLEIRDVLAAAGCAVEHHEIASPWGHDSFLLEVPAYHEVVREFVERPVARAGARVGR
jgi:homoserine O-acetyltransferase